MSTKYKRPAPHRASLADRMAEAVAKNPAFKVLTSRLLQIGGEEVIPPLSGEKDIIPAAALLAIGEVMTGPVVFEEMEPSQCHVNVARQLNAGREGLTGICTGYALSDDGLWRRHWWGEFADGRLLETTVERVTYFGMSLRDPKEFARGILRAFGCADTAATGESTSMLVDGARLSRIRAGGAIGPADAEWLLGVVKRLMEGLARETSL